jgi:DNA replication protein
MLKRLYEEFDLPIERIIMREYKRLGLSMDDAHVLLALFSIYKKRRTFSLSSIQKRVDYTINQIGASIEKLIDQQFLSMTLELKDGKQREVFSLDNTFKKIEHLYIEDEKEKQRALFENQITDTIKRFEQGLGRTLSSFELDNIRRWYDEKTYTHDAIMKAIISSEDRISIKRVEKLLNQTEFEKIQIDEDVENVLDEIYKKIK